MGLISAFGAGNSTDWLFEQMDPKLALKADKSAFDTHNADNVRHITATERTAWNDKPTNATFNAHAARHRQGGADAIGLGNGTTAGLSTWDYTAAERTKVANVPADTNASLAGKASTAHAATHRVGGTDAIGLGNGTTAGLSTNDYTTAEKTKVANVPADTNASLGAKASTTHAATHTTGTDQIPLGNGTTKGLSTWDYTAAERTKVANVPDNTNTALAGKQASLNGTGAVVMAGTTVSYVPVETAGGMVANNIPRRDGTGHIILPAANPTTDNQAARKAYVDTKQAALNGTGAVVMAAAVVSYVPVEAAGGSVASNIPRRDANQLISCNNNPTGDNHLARKGYVDSVKGGLGTRPILLNSLTTTDGQAFTVNMTNKFVLIQFEMAGTQSRGSGVFYVDNSVSTYVVNFNSGDTSANVRLTYNPTGTQLNVYPRAQTSTGGVSVITNANSRIRIYDLT